MFRNIEDYNPKTMRNSCIGVMNDFSVKVKGKPTLKPATNEEKRENFELLQLCDKYYSALEHIRREYTRNLNYKNGNQFGDIIEDPDYDGCGGKQYISEREYMIKKGRTPRQNNIINSCVRTVVGQFLSNPLNTQVLARSHDGRDGAEILTNAIQSVHDFNKYKDVRRQALNSFLTSGFGCFAASYKYVEERDKEEVVYESKSLYRMFWNNDVKDSTFDKLRVVGEIADVPLEDVISQFAKNTADESVIRNWYTPYLSDAVNDYLAELYHERNLDFFVGKNAGTVRVIVAWYKKLQWRLVVHDPLLPDEFASYPYSKGLIDEINLHNGMRIAKAAAAGMDIAEVPIIRYEEKRENVWFYKYMTPFGDVLAEGESPYLHQLHPYTLYAYPLEEGVIRGFVSDLIDGQRSINRDLMLIDFIISASAKGVLLVPEDAIPADFDETKYAEEWAKFDGIIKYKPKPGVPMPQQISSNSTNIGIFELLKVHLSMFQDQSGVTPALRGDKPNAGTPSSRYAQESFNSSLNLLDYMECFKSGLERTDEKILKLILQYYEDGRTIYNSGSKSNIFNEEKYRRAIIGHVGYDVKITEANQPPIMRQMMDDILMQLFQTQAIDVELMLENASFPFADRLLQQIRARKEKAQDEGMMQQLPQASGADMEQINQQIPPQNNAILERLLKPQGGSYV